MWLALLLTHLIASIPSSNSCVFSSPAGTYDLSALSLRHTAPDGWLYAFSACSAFDGFTVEPKCAKAAPAPAFQVTLGLQPTCFSLGTLPSRTLASLPGALGVSVAYSGGDGGRRVVLEATCFDGPATFDAAAEERPLEYVLRARSRAACPAECARDPHTGAICGGRDRGACALASGDAGARSFGGGAVCACSAGYQGSHCTAAGASAGGGGGSLAAELMALACALSFLAAAALACRRAESFKTVALRWLAPIVLFFSIGSVALLRAPRVGALAPLAAVDAPLTPAERNAEANAPSLANMEALVNATRAACARHYAAAEFEARGGLNVSVGVVIGAYQRPALLQAILKALRRQRLVSTLEVVVADSGSWPPLAQQIPFMDADQVRWWKEDGRYHRVRNFNEGAAMTRAEVVILLDDDVIPTSDYWAAAAAAALLDSPGLAMVRMPLEIREFREDLSDAPARRGELEALQWDQAFSFTTCNLAVRRSAWDSLGGFSWAFDGVYGGEDIDFHKRAKDAGMAAGQAGKGACALHAGVFFGNRGLQK
jgi:hypothetical protein